MKLKTTPAFTSSPKVGPLFRRMLSRYSLSSGALSRTAIYSMRYIGVAERAVLLTLGVG
jgi:hypothetical protein